MSERLERGIYWDKAWSLVEGCTPVSEGCDNCWSARETHIKSFQSNLKIRRRYEGLTAGGRFNKVIKLIWDELYLPWRIKKPTRFAIWNDLYHEKVPFEFIDSVFAVMGCLEDPDASIHTFLLLTKRPMRMLEYAQGRLDRHMAWPPNVWVGVTAENQGQADRRIPLLVQVPATTRFLSIEPLLGPIDLYPIYDYGGLAGQEKPYRKNYLAWLDWVIVGGESGRNARPMHPDWVRSIRDQCIAAHVPFFFKHWGEWAPEAAAVVHALHTNRPDNLYRFDDGVALAKVGKKAAGRVLDGKEWNEMPTKVSRPVRSYRPEEF